MKISYLMVLNLIINGLPSILIRLTVHICILSNVLNLIINGLPSILIMKQKEKNFNFGVLNLIINGLPSIQALQSAADKGYKGMF